MSPIRSTSTLISRDVCSLPFLAGIFSILCITAITVISSGDVDLVTRTTSPHMRSDNEMPFKGDSSVALAAAGDDAFTKLPDADLVTRTTSPHTRSDNEMPFKGDSSVALAAAGDDAVTKLLDAGRSIATSSSTPKYTGPCRNETTRLVAKPGPLKLDPKAARAWETELQWKEKPPGTCVDNSRLNKTKLGCKKRFPHILGIGMEKCGTGALSFFLRGHPNIAYTKEKELYYWNKHRDETLDYYLKQMPYSSKYQLTMEFTPSYLVTRGVPEDIKATGFQNMRFIVMLRDPIERAVSFYLHMQYFEKCMKPRVYRPPDPSGNTYPFLGDTFESTVFKPNGEVREDTRIIDDNLYVQHLERWFKVFDRRQFLIIEESDINRNPVPVLQGFERFLGITPFFDQSSVYFNKQRQLWCKKKPTSGCLDATKGRKHPEIDQEVVEKLRRYFDPYNRRLEALLGRNMSWT